MKQDYSIADVYKLIEAFRQEVREIYVTREEFVPVRAIAYGLVGTIIFSIGGGVLLWIVKVVMAK